MERTGTRRTKPHQLELTDRQVEVLRLIEQGFSNSEIAERLEISLDGAKFHVSEILAKLGVSTREEAVAAWRAGRRRMPWAWIVLGLGAAVVAAFVIVVLAAARDDSSPGDESPASVQRPTSPPTAPGFVCPPARTPTPTGRTPLPIPPMDGPSSVMFNGHRYTVVLGRAYAGQSPLDQSLVGQRVGQVCFDTSKTWPLDPSDGGDRDGDAFHMDPGTELFDVVGYRTAFRLAAKANGEFWLLQAMPNDGDYARDVLDISGRVAAVNLYGDQDGSGREVLAGSTSEPATIERLVQLLLAARTERTPIANSMNAFIRLQLILADGTAVTYGFYPDANFVDRYHVPDEFGQEIRALLAP